MFQAPVTQGLMHHDGYQRCMCKSADVSDVVHACCAPVQAYSMKPRKIVQLYISTVW